jgi:hypothetical protein
MIESLVIILFFFLVLSIMALSGYLTTRNSVLGRYSLHNKTKRLNWKKVGKWYIYLQVFLLGNKLLGNDKLDWRVVFGIPIVMIGLLLVYYFFLYSSPKDMDLELGPDFDSYKKQVERDIKINKILK